MDLSIVPDLLAQRPLAALPLVFLGGVLTSLTPCIYPMIPITAAVIGGQAAGAGRSRRRTAVLTASYVTGLAVVYASLGLLAGLTGSLFGSVSTNPWLYLLLANLLLLFAVMLLDLVAVPVPRRLLTKAASLDGRGRVVGTFAVGAASGLVAAPCGAPVMASLLTWVGVTGNAVLGFVHLFVFSLGMCSLLVVVGLAAGGAVRLPAPGPWMVRVKQAFALVLVGVAEYYLVQMGLLLF